MTGKEKRYKAEHQLCEHCQFFLPARARTGNGIPAATELHHIEGRGLGRDDESNLIHLCKGCHEEAESNVKIYQAAHKYYKDKMSHMPDYKIELPWQMVPASRPRSTVRNGKMLVYTDREYAKFKKDLAFAMQSKHMEFTSGCSVRVVYTATDWKGMDWDNCAKGMIDAVSKADNRITDARVQKIVTKGSPFIRLEIWK